MSDALPSRGGEPAGGAGRPRGPDAPRSQSSHAPGPQNSHSPSPRTPDTPRPNGDYRAAVVDGGLAMSAGMTPRVDGRLTVTGVVGRDVAMQVAQEAAGVAARNAVAAITAELDGGRIRRLLRMTVYVACADGFHALSAVADGASAGLRAVLPDAALPVRSAIGVRSLPGGAPVEVELTAAVVPPDPRP